MNGPQIPISSVMVGAEEEGLVLEVLRSGMLAQGPMVARLEEEFAAAQGVRHAVAVSNGTVALVAALKACGIGPGDEVITTSFSFNATLNAVLEVGATARFADIREDYTIDPDAVAALVNERTAAILPVHLYGMPADMTALERIARRHGLAIIEDAAQAHGATLHGRGTGSFGVGTFSLYGTKNITCGEGGLVTTGDDAIADTLRLLRNQGMRARYQYEAIGHNWRLTDLQAAVAIPQVKRMGEITARRAANAELLSRGLSGLPGLHLPQAPAGVTHSWHQYTVRLASDAPLNREEFCRALAEGGIGHGVYYPKLMHDHACYQDHPHVRIDPTPLAREFTGRVVSLPVHPALGDQCLERIIKTVRGAFDA
jgi:dTDP-4-amino-4,6-dideoxygalactose transaminase